jgi:hypothetical protein
MLILQPHQYGGTWAFYVIAPIILLGFVACLWWIVRGAIGVFGPGAAVRSQKASPLKAGRAAARFHRAAGISTMATSLPGRGTGRASSRGMVSLRKFVERAERRWIRLAECEVTRRCRITQR